MALVQRLQELAAEVNATPTQLALGWLLARGALPIPGTTRVGHLEENANAAELSLTPEQVRMIDELVPTKAVHGQRLAAAAARWVGH
ncbi:aldo/keto reductase [Micromonospora chersina]|uniref:aldo/keto reductase n=1 Tax=Micromonospora chersina TaxID=47854 RepID=UPI0033F3B17D